MRTAKAAARSKRQVHTAGSDSIRPEDFPRAVLFILKPAVEKKSGFHAKAAPIEYLFVIVAVLPDFLVAYIV